MAKVISGTIRRFGFPRAEKDRIREFYRDVLGGEITRAGDQKDDIRVGDNVYIAFRCEDEGVALDESGFLKAIYLELKADNVEEVRQKIVTFGVKVLAPVALTAGNCPARPGRRRSGRPAQVVAYSQAVPVGRAEVLVQAA
jgi:hypothetical protein